jgi:hypothetical protein
MGLVYSNPMSENKRDYAVGRGKPPVHTRFKKGQSGNPRGPRPKNLPAPLIEALNEPVTATIDGERREITKHEAVVTQLVNKSAAADLRDQDACRYAEGRREKSRRRVAALACPLHPGGRGAQDDLHHQAAAILGSFGDFLRVFTREKFCFVVPAKASLKREPRDPTRLLCAPAFAGTTIGEVVPLDYSLLRREDSENSFFSVLIRPIRRLPNDTRPPPER